MVGSEITDDTVEPLAFAVCNTDGSEGLSWPEVDQCELSKYVNNKTFREKNRKIWLIFDVEE